MFLRFKQLVVFHLAIAAALSVSLIPFFQGEPDEASKRAYEAVMRRGAGFEKVSWNGSKLVETRNTELKDAPQLLILRFDKDTASTFQSNPPSPVDYAVVLYELNQYLCRRVAISDPLFWEDQSDPDSSMRQLGFATLLQEMSPFDRILLGSGVDRSIQPQPLGTAMQAAAIPLNHIHGEISALPAANQLPFDFPKQLPEQVKLTPTHIDGQPDFIENPSNSSIRVPLFVRWGDQVLPTFCMGLVMDLLGTNISEITVELGSHVKFATGNQIIIDEFGFAEVLLQSDNAPLGMSASDLLLEDGEDRSPNQEILDQAGLVLISQTTQSPPPLKGDSPQQYDQRGDFLAHAANALAAKSAIQHTTVLKPAESWVNWLLIFNVSVLGAFFYGRPKGRVSYLCLLLTGTAALLCYLALKQGVWISLAAPLAAIVTCLLSIPLLGWWRLKEIPASEIQSPEPSVAGGSERSREEIPQLVELAPDIKSDPASLEKKDKPTKNSR